MILVHCPRCQAPMGFEFWEEIHPYGSTVAYEPMADCTVKHCECELSDEEWDTVFTRAKKCNDEEAGA